MPTVINGPSNVRWSRDRIGAADPLLTFRYLDWSAQCSLSIEARDTDLDLNVSVRVETDGGDSECL